MKAQNFYQLLLKETTVLAKNFRRLIMYLKEISGFEAIIKVLYHTVNIRSRVTNLDGFILRHTFVRNFLQVM